MIHDRRNRYHHSEAGQRQARENVGPPPIGLRRKETTTNKEETKTAYGRSETHATLLFGSGALLHDEFFSGSVGENVPSLFFPSSQQKASVGNGRFGYLVHTLFFGIQ